MTANRPFLFRVFFKLKVHETHGDAFQKLFSQVMQYADPRFESIVPYGNWGDGGNDGWIQEDGHYFQLYGPRPTTKDTAPGALQKALDDYDKLPKKWKDVRRFSFVFNDRFDGTPAPIASALQELKISKKLQHAACYSMQKLLATFMSLPEEQRQDILSASLPDDEVELTDQAALGELLTSLTAITAAQAYFLSETAPEFEAKITFNGLSPAVSHRLRSASYQVSIVDDFLETLDAGTRQALAQQIHGYYSESKEAIPDGEDAPDQRYFWLVGRLVPSQNLSKLQTAAFRPAAELILAKYFETCDAYEHPDSASAS
jgi:hypothetical protein